MADIVHAERGLTKRDGSLDDRRRMVEKTIPERGNAKRRHDATVRPRPKVFFLFSILVLRGLGHFLAVRGERIAAALFVQPARVVDLDRALHRAMTSALV